MKELDRAIAWALRLEDADRLRVVTEISEGLRYGNIRNLGSHLRALPDLSIFNGCFPRSIRMKDEDGCAEINGYVLRYDQKAPGADVPAGEWNTAVNLARDRGDTTIFAWGHRSQIRHARLVLPGALDTGDFPANQDVLRHLAHEWGIYADAHLEFKWPREAPQVAFGQAGRTRDPIPGPPDLAEAA